jgi:hypothetical protein
MPWGLARDRHGKAALDLIRRDGRIPSAQALAVESTIWTEVTSRET